MKDRIEERKLGKPFRLRNAYPKTEKTAAIANAANGFRIKS
jgi:hypothetical protein